MRRWLGRVALPVVAGLLAVVGGATAAAAAAPTTPDPVPCADTGPVQIISLAFAPPAVAPGQSSTATLRAGNCTAQTVQANTTWIAKFVGTSSTGIPAGCPAISPLVKKVTFDPFGAVSTSVGYLVFPGCSATSLELTVRISQGATLLATGTTTLQITGQPIDVVA